MILPESALGDYWLQVWRRFVEAHWDYITTGTSSECYNFAHLRKCQPKMVVDDQVADLATNYWKRNRSKLKEYFINWTCDKWSYEVAIEKDVNGGWIDYGADLAYPHRRHEGNTNDAPYLAKTGRLQLMLKKAELDAFLEKCWNEEQNRLAKFKRRTKAKLKLLKMKIKKMFKKCFS